MKKTKKVLFHLNYLYHLPAVEPIIELFASDKNYDTVIFLALDFDYKFGIFRKKKPNDYLSNFISKNIRIADINEEFDIVFVTDVIDKSLYPNAQLCMVYHGPTFNKTVTYRELRKHDSDNYLFFAESQYAVDRLFESKSLGNSSIEIVGFPKMDPILNKKYNRSSILKQLELDVNKKTILYAPTYKPTSIYDLKDEIFDATKDYNLIVKLHHYSWMGKYAKRSQSKLIQKQIDKYDHAILFPRDSYNIIPLFAVADTLISEASGALTEFIITEKVGIVYNITNRVKKHSDNQPLLSIEKDFLKDAHIQIDSPAELKQAIQLALNPKKDRLNIIKKNKERYFYKCDGEASRRLKSIIDNLFL